MTRRYLWDLETDGLLEKVSVVHCAWVFDVDTGERWGYRPHEIPQFFDKIAEATVHIGHNLEGYDLPVLKKLYDFTLPADNTVIDTLIAARMAWPDIRDRDFNRKGFPANLIGRHSLEAYGHRIGEYKGEFGKGADWSTFTEEMYDYCEQDVVVNLEVFKRLEKKGLNTDALDMEYRVAEILKQQQTHGWPFDVKAAIKLYADMAQERDDIGDRLRGYYGEWFASAGVTTPKKTIKYKNKPWITEGASYTKLKIVQFNPGSRAHLAKVLLEAGWKPKKYTPTGKPVVDETSLSGLRFKGANDMYLFLNYQKLIGQLAEGKQAWLNQVKDGRIHHRCDPFGTVTSRASHSGPNLGQVPSGKKVINERAVGKECRGLFIGEPGWVAVGADQAGLELRCLAHYLYIWDEGAYVKAILEGDIHTVNQMAAGLSTRDEAKTFIYAFLYGAGDEKIGSIVGGSKRKGAMLKAQFLAGLPALDRLLKAVKSAAKKRGGVKTLDGRIIPIRSKHAALNFLLQSTGAIICKRWMVITHDLMEAKGYAHGEDYRQHGFIHDELQFSCPPDVVADLTECLQEAGRLAGEYYDFNCPTASDVATGTSWKDTH